MQKKNFMLFIPYVF